MSVKFLLAAINSKYIHMNPAVYSLRTYVLGSGALNAGNAEIARRNHFARGRFVAENKVGNGIAAFHAALPRINHGRNAAFFGKVFAIDNSARVYNNDGLFKIFAKQIQKILFLGA